MFKLPKYAALVNGKEIKMRSQEARNYIQSLKHLDPGVVRVADRTFCQLGGDPEIQAEEDGSIRLLWKDWAHDQVRLEVKVYKAVDDVQGT